MGALHSLELKLSYVGGGSDDMACTSKCNNRKKSGRKKILCVVFVLLPQLTRDILKNLKIVHCEHSLLLVVFSACGGIPTGIAKLVSTAYFPVLA